MFKKRYLFLAIFLILFLGLSQVLFRVEADYKQTKRPFLPTTYEYSASKLENLHSTLLISEDGIDKWNKTLENYFKREKVSTPKKWRFYTYLYMAQKDAAFLSYNTHRCFLGSLDPLTHSLVLQFFPSFSDEPELTSDPYSEMLAEIVLRKYEARIKQENESTKTFQSQCWLKETSTPIADVAKWTPWISPLPKPPPPSGNEETQVKMMERMRCNLTDEQIQMAKECNSFNFVARINSYIEENCVPLGKALLARAVVLQGLYDALIAAIHSKYTYCVLRPVMIDSSVNSMFPKLNTPAYPSGHATTAMAAATILSHFFPEDCFCWREMAEQIGESRIWAGVHTPEDVEAGYELGEEVGLAEIANSIPSH